MKNDSKMMDVSILVDRDLKYSSQPPYSPVELYPEYPFRTGKPGQNSVYGAVRECLAQFQGDPEGFGTARWNPLRPLIAPGRRVFVLPNHVMHLRENEELDDFHAKCTHASVLRPVIDYAVLAAGDPELVSIGNAPIQGCDYSAVTELAGARAIADFYRREGLGLRGPLDLRRVVSRWNRFGAMIEKKLRSSEAVVAIDLGAASYLDELYDSCKTDRLNFRVGDYPPSDTMSFHEKGRHVYMLNRRVLEADVIVSVPKLKTHQKVALTCALKGTVGAIAHKECLAHHRSGTGRDGGDEYRGGTWAHALATRLAESAAGKGNTPGANLLRVSSKAMYRFMRRVVDPTMGGAWYGNDTAWRMSLDIARILRYGRMDGTMARTPVRDHIVFIDGILAGEGNGPLRPRAKHLGAVIFAPDPASADVAAALLAGFDPAKIPIIANAFRRGPYALTDLTIESLGFILNGNRVGPAGLRAAAGIGGGLEPPPGWKGKIETDEHAA